VVEVVEASASVDPAGSSVDVASLLTPAAPEIAHALASAGVPVPVDQVETLVEGLDPFVVRQPSSVSYLGAASPVAVRFGTAAVLSLVVMLVSGWVAVATSDERLVEVQRLLARVALGALSYAVILRVGSWILDPDGGRAPLVETVSSIAGSKWLVPMAIASGAALLSGAVWLVGRSVRPEATSPLPVEAPKPQEERELSRIG
jgi:hypothetical protein